MSRTDDILPSRRDALALGISNVGLMAAARASPAIGRGVEQVPGWRPGPEGQRQADLGNGSFRNPVLGGDHADPNVLKDGDDYYATFSSFLYYPAVVIWHSRDLVNWTPIGPALTVPLGSVFALDLAKHEGRYFVYIPVFAPPAAGRPSQGPPFKIYAIHAADMRGPWSEPIDMGIDGFIDPGHIVGEDGHRYLFLNDGHRVRISDDGLSRAGPIEKVYEGWVYPSSWVVEGFALEGPKLLRRGDWFYMFSGQGGTAGPPTSHMVIVARARSIHGPWENCPQNPIVHTASRDEPWWSRGHATAVQGPAGNWWLVYHGYENGMRTLGRQMLLEPFRWTAEGWPEAMGGDLSRALPMPRGLAAKQGSPAVKEAGLALSDDFSHAMFGSRWTFYAPAAGYMDRVRFDRGSLILKGQGEAPGGSSPLALIAGDRSYEVTVDVELSEHGGKPGKGGLLLFYDDNLYCGLGVSEGKFHAYKLGKEVRFPPAGAASAGRLSMRVVNDANVASFFYRYGASAWIKHSSFEVSGYNHNIGDGFLSLRPALFSSGDGSVVFRSMRYRAL